MPLIPQEKRSLRRRRVRACLCSAVTSGRPVRAERGNAETAGGDFGVRSRGSMSV